jgi:hypothetical protein
MSYEPPFQYRLLEVGSHLEACPADEPEMAATFFAEQYPNAEEAKWKLARFLNYQAYLTHSLSIPEVRDEFVESDGEGVRISPDFMKATWSFMGHAPDHLLGQGLPLPELLAFARENRRNRQTPTQQEPFSMLAGQNYKPEYEYTQREFWEHWTRLHSLPNDSTLLDRVQAYFLERYSDRRECDYKAKRILTAFCYFDANESSFEEYSVRGASGRFAD